MNKRRQRRRAIGPQLITPEMDLDRRAGVSFVGGQIARFGQISPELLRRSIRVDQPLAAQFLALILV